MTKMKEKFERDYNIKIEFEFYEERPEYPYYNEQIGGLLMKHILNQERGICDKPSDLFFGTHVGENVKKFKLYIDNDIIFESANPYKEDKL